MKITISTTYDNVSEEFLDYWLQRFRGTAEYGPDFIDTMKTEGHYTYRTQNDGIIGTTTYTVVRDSQSPPPSSLI